MPVCSTQTELEKVVAPFTVMVGAAGEIAATAADSTVMVMGVVAVVPAALVTVRVKVLPAVRGPEMKASTGSRRRCSGNHGGPAEKVGVMWVEPP